MRCRRDHKTNTDGLAGSVPFRKTPYIPHFVLGAVVHLAPTTDVIVEGVPPRAVFTETGAKKTTTPDLPLPYWCRGRPATWMWKEGTYDRLIDVFHMYAHPLHVKSSYVEWEQGRRLRPVGTCPSGTASIKYYRVCEWTGLLHADRLQVTWLERGAWMPRMV